MSEKSVSSAPAANEIKQLSPEASRMLDVIIALIPSVFAGIAVFGIRAAAVIAVTVGSAVLFEQLYCVIRKSPSTVKDLSAVVTGLVLAFSLPVKAPFYVCIFGSAIAIIAVKLLAGGRGKNLLNPAITARAALFIAFTPALTGFTVPSRNPVDAVSCATPLQLLSQLDKSADIATQISRMVEAGEMPGLMNMLFGVKAGCIGEGCAAALLLGGIYLILRGVISFVLPLTYLGSLALVTFVCTGFSPILTLYYLLSGAVLFCAFFVITEPVTAADTLKKRLICGTAAGAVTAIIRFFTPLSEGVMLTVILMNLVLFTVKLIPVIKAKITKKKDKATEPVGDVAHGIPSDPTEETDSEPVGDVAHGIPSEEIVTPEKTTPEAENSPSLVGDGVLDVPPVSTKETDSEPVGDVAHGIPPEEITSPEETTPEAENSPSLVGDVAHGIPPEKIAAPATKKTAKPVFVNELSSDPDFSRQAKPEAPQKTKKQGRKAKKKGKIMPDFSEPLPEVIPEFLKKEIEKQKNQKSE